MPNAIPATSAVTSIPTATDIVVLGCSGADSPVLVGAGELRKAYARGLGELDTVALGLGAAAKVGTTTLLPAVGGGPRLLVTGIGDGSPAEVRRGVGAAVRAAASLDDDHARVAISLDLHEPELVRAAVDGALQGAYRYAKVSKTETKASVSELTVVVDGSRSDLRDARGMVERAAKVSAAVWQARDWVNAPANLLYPDSFAREAAALFKGVKADIEVLDERQLEKDGYGGLLAVGGGSSRPPRLVRVEYAPRGATAHLVLVGKGITFDTGGLNLKPSDGMYTMKDDMAGAAAVLAATHAIAGLGLGVKVTSYGCLAENMPSSTAYRPSDVITMYGGTTVENGNSDAEGRIVMADALARSNADGADLVIDVATLTGACMVALGAKTAGLFASDDETADHLLDAAEAAGEAFWQLPITDEARAALDSKVADLRSTGTSRYGGASVAAAFLQRFVDDERPWAHLDIAGPAWNGEPAYDGVPAGGTGFAVRTLVALAESMQR